jgi:hypothetical protein
MTFISNHHADSFRPWRQYVSPRHNRVNTCDGVLRVRVIKRQPISSHVAIDAKPHAVFRAYYIVEYSKAREGIAHLSDQLSTVRHQDNRPLFEIPRDVRKHDGFAAAGG